MANLTPWHMWGTHKRVTIPDSSSSALQYQTTTQLARVNYGRPENWRFLFGLEVLSAQDSNGNPAYIYADFDLIVGVGRSQMTLSQNIDGKSPGFCRLCISYNGLPSLVVGRQKWAASTPSPPLDESLATPVSYLIDHVPAENIQCSVRLSVGAASAIPGPYVVNAHAYFAPNVHLRPDWFARGDETERFQGDEKGGK